MIISRILCINEYLKIEGIKFADDIKYLTRKIIIKILFALRKFSSFIKIWLSQEKNVIGIQLTKSFVFPTQILFLNHLVRTIKQYYMSKNLFNIVTGALLSV